MRELDRIGRLDEERSTLHGLEAWPVEVHREINTIDFSGPKPGQHEPKQDKSNNDRTDPHDPRRGSPALQGLPLGGTPPPRPQENHGQQECRYEDRGPLGGGEPGASRPGAPQPELLPLRGQVQRGTAATPGAYDSLIGRRSPRNGPNLNRADDMGLENKRASGEDCISEPTDRGWRWRLCRSSMPARLSTSVLFSHLLIDFARNCMLRLLPTLTAGRRPAFTSRKAAQADDQLWGRADEPPSRCSTRRRGAEDLWVCAGIFGVRRFVGDGECSRCPFWEPNYARAN